MEPQVATLSPPVDPARDHIRGDADAPVTLVEYGDFQCPYCGEAYPVVNDLLERFGDRLAFVFRHMPLPDLHPRAPFAAEAAEAAAAQGRFWEMHDRLFEHQHQLTDAELRAHAEAVGVAGRERASTPSCATASTKPGSPRISRAAGAAASRARHASS